MKYSIYATKNPFGIRVMRSKISQIIFLVRGYVSGIFSQVRSNIRYSRYPPLLDSPVGINAGNIV